MSEHLKRLAARFDALALRERGLIFAGVLLAVLFLSYVLAIEPKITAKKRLTQQIADARQMSLTLQQQLKAQSQDPSAARRAERDALRKQLAEIDKTMGHVQRGLVPPERTAKLLEEVLRSRGSLQLVSLRTLPVQRFDPVRGGGEGSGSDAERQLYQHSFEISVQGTYADLYEYLRRVEQLPWRLLWSRINVSVDPEQHPKLSVTLTVQTVSLSKAWLVL